MRFDARVVVQLTLDVLPIDFLRVTPMRHADEPLGMGFGKTRFASPSKAFRLLYLGADLTTSIAEAILRDRFVGRRKRRVTVDEIESWGVTSVNASSPLALLDLRGNGCFRLGLETETVRGKRHNPVRRFSEAFYPAFPAIDGILYQSRILAAPCIAVYDRAVDKLAPTPVRPLYAMPGLTAAMDELGVEMI